MKIKLLNSNLLAIIDDTFSHLAKTKWRLLKSRDSFYIGRKTSRNGKGMTIYLHREVMGFPKGMVDHRDGDIFNNRKSNLRVCTNSQNQMNSKKRKNTSSQYKGVSRDKMGRGWKVQLAKDGHDYFIGYFDNERHAALAYDLNASLLFGEFASLNFKD